jgi:transcriptional regulator with XRE-family HTH domain
LSPTAITPDQFSTFGELLKYLRRQARITQRELAIAVGYSDTQISRIEQEPKWVARLLKLAKAAQADGVSEMHNKADSLSGAVPLTPCAAAAGSIPLQMKTSRNIRKPGHNPAR